VKRWLVLILFPFLLSAALVTTALFFRQTPHRSGTDAYLPIRALSAIEGAALLKAEDTRKPSDYSRTVVTGVDEGYVRILTRDYPIQVAAPTETVPESHGSVTVAGQTFRLVSNSWESYVSFYKIPRKPLEALVGRTLSVTSIEERNRSRFNEDKVSFSSEKVLQYAITEVIVLSSLLFVVAAVFTKCHWLLWLPGVAGTEFSLFLFVRVYSPAFMDADWFHQRIVIEDIAGLLMFPLTILFPAALFLVPASVLGWFAVVAQRSQFVRRLFHVNKEEGPPNQAL